MKDLKVRDLRPYETASKVDTKASMFTIVQEFIKNPSLHHLCVVDEQGKLLGLINRKRLFKSLFHHHIKTSARVSELFSFATAETSQDIMLTHVYATHEDEPLDKVIETMIEHNFREMPVLDEEGRVLGFVTLLIIMKKYLEYHPEM